MKTIVFAYSEFGCVGIEQLLAAGYDIAAVFTYRDDPKETVFYRSVAKVCVENGVKAYTLDNSNDSQWLARIRAIAPDYMFSFYYRELLPDAILAEARKGAFNLHGSLLPRYRGRAPVNWVLVKGETETGVTLHHMVRRADAGDIVAQEKTSIAHDDTAFTLQRKLIGCATRLLAAQLPLIARGTAARIPQDITQGEYCGRRTAADGQIDWTQPAETVRNLVRAVTQPYPGAFTWHKGEKLLIWDSSVASSSANAAPGTVISLSPLTIACGSGALTIKAGQVGEGGLYLSGVQLAEALSLSPKASFLATSQAA
jgi:UDP-4-amino-4-deoxy-L-arabinose formyltransferase/UDP-glucuronic acid dehydrogenase (UDP-4-keto-hexauronic acid decarboxylating)